MQIIRLPTKVPLAVSYATWLKGISYLTWPKGVQMCQILGLADKYQQVSIPRHGNKVFASVSCLTWLQGAQMCQTIWLQHKVLQSADQLSYQPPSVPTTKHREPWLDSFCKKDISESTGHTPYLQTTPTGHTYRPHLQLYCWRKEE